MKIPIRPVVGIALALAVSACAHRSPDRPPVYSPAGPGAYAQYGRVTHIETLGSSRETSGAGAVAGGVIGAVVGRQIASDSKAAGTVIGGVAGAVIGNEIEKDQRRSRERVRVTVRLDGGMIRYFDFAQVGDLRVGDRVRVDGDRLSRW
jgi:outer membrane lipoprotein SlyB